MPYRDEWVPPKTGVPPWMPPAMHGGFWTSQYVEGAEERRTRELREQQARELADSVSSALARARSVDEVAEALRTDVASAMFDSDSCQDAWEVITKSPKFPAAHDLVHWKGRPREWGFYFRWLPDCVVSERSRGPAWRVPGVDAWVDADGMMYERIDEISPGAIHWTDSRTRVIVGRNARFALQARRLAPGTRPEYFLVHGTNVEGTRRVNAADLRRLLGLPTPETNDNDLRRRARVSELEGGGALTAEQQAELARLRQIEARRFGDLSA
jgi:hypothetical protein